MVPIIPKIMPAVLGASLAMRCLRSHVYIRNNVMRNYGNNYTEIRILYPNGGI